MYFDVKENLSRFAEKSPNFATAVNWLLKTDLNALPLGNQEIDGRNVYVMVQEYTTKDRSDCRLELHRNYTDIQYVVSGGEYMAYVPKDFCVPETEYNPDADMTFCKFLPGESYFYVPGNSYCIFEPKDGHVGSFHLGSPAPVRKVIVKVKIDYEL